MNRLSVFVVVCGVLFASFFASSDFVQAQTVIGSDDFDGGGNFVTRVFSPDNASTGGLFPSADPSDRGFGFDVFGIVNRDVNFNFADDSIVFPGDDTGIISTSKTDSFLGIQDLKNDDNPGGQGTVTWTFDVAGLTDLGLLFDVAAMGDFEGPDNSSGDPANADTFTLQASFDDGPKSLLASGGGIDDGQLAYTLESGTQVTLDDPYKINGTILNNNFQRLNFPIVGSGSQLELEFNWVQEGGREVLAFDNLELLADFSAPSGDFDLDGDVDVDDIDAFAAALGQNATGAFTEFDFDFDGTITLDDLQIHVENFVQTSNGQTGTFSGDANLDGVVDEIDEAIVDANLNQAVSSWSDGDFDSDGFVSELGDKFLLLANFGNSNSNPASVPEPSGFAIWLLMSGSLLSRRRDLA